MLRVLARYPVIFSHIEHNAMAAEAPDLHMGDLGHLEKVRNGLVGVDTPLAVPDAFLLCVTRCNRG